MTLFLFSCLSSQSLDELDDDDVVPKDRREEELVQANTFQNEAMIADPTTGHFMVRSNMTLVSLSYVDLILDAHYVFVRLIHGRCQTEALLLREIPWELNDTKLL